VKIALLGYGKMGHMIETLAPRHGMEIGERFTRDRPLGSDDLAKQTAEDYSVILDFSVSEAVLDNIRTAGGLSKSMVIGTTGWHHHIEEARRIVERSNIGLVYAANFSIGVHLFYKIIGRAGELFRAFDSYDPFLVESHHKFKKDAPSGTAQVLKGILEDCYQDRALPVTSVRAGYVSGCHSVTFDSPVDTVRIEHMARSREGFAEGALLAAGWIAKRKGIFEFQDVVNSLA